MEFMDVARVSANVSGTKNNTDKLYSSLPNPKLLSHFDGCKQFSTNGDQEQFHLFCDYLLAADEILQKIGTDPSTIINNGTSFLIHSTAVRDNTFTVNPCLADFKAGMTAGLLQHGDNISNPSVMESILLNRLKDGLAVSKTSQELFQFLTEFCFANQQYSQVWNSDAGKQTVINALIDLGITNEEIDQCVISCFKHKNLFALEALLSLPGADLQLLVSQEDQTFRPSSFDKTQHGVYIWSSNKTKRLLPLLHLAIQQWPEAVPVLLTLGADIHFRDYYPERAEKYYGNSPVSNYYEFSSGGMTPLHAACVLNQTTIIEALLKAGAVIDSRDENGLTPLHMAARHNHPEAINLLVARLT